MIKDPMGMPIFVVYRSGFPLFNVDFIFAFILCFPEERMLKSDNFSTLSFIFAYNV